MAIQIQIRRDTANNWSNNNPVLANWEIWLETDTDKIKIWNWTNNWSWLSYFWWVWWNISWTISNQTDLQNALDNKQDILTEWEFVDWDKTKLDWIESWAEVNTINSWDNVSLLNNDAWYISDITNEVLWNLSNVNFWTLNAWELPIYDATNSEFVNATITGWNSISIANADGSITINSDFTPTSTDTLKNKTIDTANNTLTIWIGDIKSWDKTWADPKAVTWTAWTSWNFMQWNIDWDAVDSWKASPSGAVVGTTDTQTLTNKTVSDRLIFSNNIPLNIIAQSTVPTPIWKWDWYIDDWTNTASWNVWLRYYNWTSWVDVWATSWGWSWTVKNLPNTALFIPWQQTTWVLVNFQVPFDFTLDNWIVSLEEKAEWSDFKIEILKNWTNVTTATITTWSTATNDLFTTEITGINTSFSKSNNDRFTINITQVWSTVAWSGFSCSNNIS